MKQRTDFETMRIKELLAKRATEGLDTAETDELVALGADADRTMDEAAALLDVATLRHEAMPPDLVDKVLAAALGSAAGSASSSSTTAPAVPAVSLRTDHLPVVTATRPAPKEPPSSKIRRTRILLVAGWSTALVAASLAVYLRVASRDESAPRSPVAGAAIDTANDAVTFSWQGRDVSGSVVWSHEQQRGQATLSGLQVNDPSVARYQLWIFDSARDERYPIDGGLFDVVAEPTSIPIVPRVRVDHVKSFMVTREAPGGAVVSTREHVLATTP